jgi:hypothetical protein
VAPFALRRGRIAGSWQAVFRLSILDDETVDVEKLGLLLNGLMGSLNRKY